MQVVWEYLKKIAHNLAIFFKWILLSCVLAAIIGYAISGYFGAAAPSYSVFGIPSLTILPVLQVLLLAVLCAGISILFFAA